MCIRDSRIAAQKEQIKYVESCLKDLKKQYDNLAPGKAQLEMRAEIDACTKALQEDKNILSSLEMCIRDRRWTVWYVARLAVMIRWVSNVKWKC